MTDITTRANGRRVLKAIAPKPKTNGEIVDELIAQYDKLNARADAAIEDFIETRMRPRAPSVPAGVIRQCSFTAPAGFTRNVCEELRLLKAMATDYA